MTTHSLSKHILPQGLQRVLPGLALSAGLAALGLLVWQASGHYALVSPMIVAMIIGIALGNSGVVRADTSPGTAVALRPVLRTGIVLLGFRLTLGDLSQLGIPGLAALAAVVTVTFFAIRRMGRLLGVSPKLSELIAAGSSICGASAVLGMNTATRARDEDIAYAIACVTVFGSLSMLLFPLLQPLAGFDDHAFGIWAGAAIHEVAQAVGAGWSVSDTAGDSATITKLSRVLLLAPMVFGAGLLRHRKGGLEGGTAGGLPVPWFVFGFLACIGVNTFVPFPQTVVAGLQLISTFMLAAALGAMGYETRLAALRMQGLRPLLLGFFGWLFISLAGAAMAVLLSVLS